VDARFFAIVSDLSGAPCELIDESGDIAWRARVTNCLHYNYLRYYDPEIGHYISLDPLGLAPAANPVGYVDRPSASCDPRASLPRSHRSRPSRTRHPIFPTWHRISTRKEG
jgi:hypothetical protein